MSTLPKVSDIGGDLYSRNELRKYFGQKSAIAFVGAGASVEMYGTWQSLLKCLIDETKKRGLATDEDRDFWRQQASRRPQQVARAIKHAFGESRIFEEVLAEYFKPKINSETRNDFTPLHQAIAELPFKGIVTTNYDNGLVRALAACSPGRNLIEGTWKDESIVNQWFNRDIFKDDIFPVLYAHGCYNRPETIVIDNDKYREAYKDSAYLRLFQYLWAAEHLVIVGFGFSDTWIESLLDNILTYLVHGVGTRHVAILGLREEEFKYAQQLRFLMQNAYNALVLFYPVRKTLIDGKITEDHSELLSTLRSLKVELSPTKVSGPIEVVRQAERKKIFSLQSRDFDPR